MEILSCLDYNQTRNEVDSMGRTIIEINGKRFVLIPEAEFAAIEKASLPPFPPVFEDGSVEAQPYICASIARDIIKERRELGLTQVQLAKLAMIRQGTLARLESGQHKPSVRTVEGVDAALKRKRAKKK
jgi:ribosome-binding protein aMBF1 (putative translation factor)